MGVNLPAPAAVVAIASKWSFPGGGASRVPRCTAEDGFPTTVEEVPTRSVGAGAEAAGN
jgi:hypothetical protein